MNKKLLLFTIFLCNAFVNIFAQNKSTQIFDDSLVKPRMRIIIDNDFGVPQKRILWFIHQGQTKSYKWQN